MTIPPKYQHEQYNENLYEWTERGVEDPHNTDWSHVFYTCQFCPGRGDEPEDVDHSPACPVYKERDEPEDEGDGPPVQIREYEPRHPGESRQVEIESTIPVYQAYRQEPRRWRYVFTISDWSDNTRLHGEGDHASLSKIYAPGEPTEPGDPDGAATIAINGAVMVPEFVREALMEYADLEGFGRPPFIPDRDGDPGRPVPKRGGPGGEPA